MISQYKKATNISSTVAPMADTNDLSVTLPLLTVKEKHLYICQYIYLFFLLRISRK